ncbi:Putative vacuolar protein sorting-associated protein TDA6 [Trichoderma ghanense]|uniref:Vacuolar protein sorting-associated protein TDA6 n=1 Tax=Trichoderma ghanense TaxID=65468 RepID=A0ABY2GPR5_9HYPO
MAGQRSFSQRLCGLSIALLALHCLCVLCKPTARDDAGSILALSNRIVPEYVTRYAPLVWLHSDDPFRPADLLQHIRHTTPTINQTAIPDLPELDLDNLAILNDIGGGKVALTSNDDITTLPAWLYGSSPDDSGRIANATPCVVILVEHNARNVDAFYFYFYSYDRGANITQVLQPLNRLIEDTEHGMHFGDHVGDWEHNMVRFRDGKPIGIWYSQHVSGAAYAWDHKALLMKDERPLVFSAYGSHANYVSPGDHIHDSALVDYCDAGRLWDPVLSAYFYHLDPATFELTHIFQPKSNVSAATNLTSFFYYTGLWGDAQYPDSDPRQKTVPHFGLKRFVSGPQGPIVKQLVRKKLSPDNPGKKSWMQWAVGVFMSLYPCCLRGWRVWVSATVAITIVILAIFGVRYSVKYGMKRYRARKGYRKLDTDIPLNDINGSGESSGLHSPS